jgi:hypothetical protein
MQNLYWTKTPCNAENWFIIAASQKEASNFHDDGEGFDRGYSKSREICSIPKEIFKAHHREKDNYWPSLELLEALGFTVVEREFPRIVSHDSKIYYEGTGMIKIIEYHTSKVPGLYVINVLNTDKYKVGFTKNLSARLSAFRTAIPFPIRLKFYIMTEFHKELEKELHRILLPNLARREWFSLNEVEINKLKEKLNKLDKSKFHFVDYTEMPYER